MTATAQRIVFVLFPDFQILDLTGPHEVFAQTRTHVADGSGLVIETVAATGAPVPASGGLAVTPTSAAGELRGPVDTLIAVGGRGVGQACEDAWLVDWFVSTSRRARRTASVCSGALLLARAGLLNGRRAVTHWSRCAELAALYPEVMVDPEPIFIRDGDIWTSAGVTAGIDLALAMVEEDHGAAVSRSIARQLVMFVQRSGGQGQFSAQLTAQQPSRAQLREVQRWIADHLADDLAVPVLAARAGMSERNFARVFRAETGRTPAAYVEASRVEAARRLLETTDTTVQSVARVCGFGTAETMHRSFRRTVRVTPGEYRRHFGSN